MEKTDEVLFGKYKGLLWKDLLSSDEGRQWGDWWSETHSIGKYANRENKMKNIWREWRGLTLLDTRVQTVGFNPVELFKKLDIIEKKIDTLIPQETEEWTHE